MVDGICQGIEYQEGRQVRCFSELKLRRTPPGSNQDTGAHAGILRSLQVGDGITNANGAGKVQLVAFCGLQKQPGAGFPAGTSILWRMRANETVIHASAILMDNLENVVVNFQGCLQGHQTPPNRRLVGNKNDLERRAVQGSQRSQGLRQKVDIRQAADVIGLIFDNHPIPIEE